jgi:hypothetical protein
MPVGFMWVRVGIYKFYIKVMLESIKCMICLVPELFYRWSGSNRQRVGLVYCTVTFALSEVAWS